MCAELQPLPSCNPLIEERRSRLRTGDSIVPTIADLTTVTDEFADHFSQAGLRQINEVPITAKLDPSVRFIGAPISVMKPLFLNNEIPPEGAFMVQNCIRTRGVNSIFDTEQTPKYGSFFTGLCVLVEYDRLSELGHEAYGFLKGRLGIEDRDICINVNEGDSDLSEVANELGLSNTFFNEKPQAYYRHKYGIDDVWGRNFNFGVRSESDGSFEDIGNLIVIENEDGQLGVELALGDTTILKQIYGLQHILDSYGLDIAPEGSPDAVRRKLEDAVITCLALFREGLRPSASNNQTRLLRTYVKALSFHRQLLGLHINTLKGLIRPLEVGRLPFACEDQTAELCEAALLFERNLEINGPSNKEDLIIVRSLGRLASNG